MIRHCIVFGLLYLFSWANLCGYSLIGTSGIVYQSAHHVFNNGDAATGFVRLNNGFTVLAGAKATLDTLVTVSGGIDLRTTGILSLNGELHLSAGVTLTAGGKISGHDNAIFLGSDLTVPENATLAIVSNTIIDGAGKTLILSPHAQFTVEANTTLTLRNMVLKTTRNSVNRQPLFCNSTRGRIAFENVVLSLGSDFKFKTGSLFFHQDVVVTGTSSFIYESSQRSYITNKSLLKFSPGTTFFFDPKSGDIDLIQMANRSSGIYLEGSDTTLTTSSGLRLTRGRMWLDNKVTLSVGEASEIIGSTMTQVDRENYGSSAREVAWRPDAAYFAVGGLSPSGSPGGSDRLQIYRFDGTSIIFVDGVDTGGQIESLNWDLTGQYVAIGLFGPSGGPGGGDELQIFSFDGSTLTYIDSVNVGGTVEGVSFSPDGTYLAMCGNGQTGGPGGTHKFQVFSFDGLTLTYITSVAWGFAAYPVAFHPDGNFIAIGGLSPSSGDELEIYSFNGSTLTKVAGVNYGSQVWIASWSNDGNYLGVGGQSPGGGHDELEIYSWDGASLSLITTVNYGSSVRAISWPPFDNGHILVGGQTPGGGHDDIELYDFDGATLTLRVTQDYGALVERSDWSPDPEYVLVGGDSSAVGHDNIEVYRVDFRPGGFAALDPVLGVDELDVYILSGATVNLYGSASF